MDNENRDFQPQAEEISESELRRLRAERRQIRPGAGKVAALCVCCALFGSVLSGAVFYSLSLSERNNAVNSIYENVAPAPADTNVAPAPEVQTPPADTSAGESTPDPAPADPVKVQPPSAGTTDADPLAKPDAADELTATDVYYAYAPSVVGITTELTSSVNVFGQVSTATVSGTGFFISSDGYVLTNAHVVEEARNVTVTDLNGVAHPAEVVGYDSDYEVGVLKITSPDALPAVTTGSIDDILVGQQVYVIGNPLGELTYSITPGIVSALDRDINIDGTAINAFQISAAVNEGNSGGPVFAENGKVVGIVTAKKSGVGVEGLGFAIPIDEALSVANDLIVNGYVTGKPYFGIAYDDIDSAIISYYNLPRGVYVKSVEEGSCAQKAGIVSGDIITAVDDIATPDSDALKSAKKKYSAGDTAQITVFRGTESLQLTVTFDEEPFSAVR